MINKIKYCNVKMKYTLVEETALSADILNLNKISYNFWISRNHVLVYTVHNNRKYRQQFDVEDTD